MGIIGYSVFLWHILIIRLLLSYPSIEAMLPPQRFPVVLAATSTIVLILGTGFYLTIEKPFMRLGRKHKEALSPAEAELREPVKAVEQVGAGANR